MHSVRSSKPSLFTRAAACAVFVAILAGDGAAAAAATEPTTTTGDDSTTVTASSLYGTRYCEVLTMSHLGYPSQCGGKRVRAGEATTDLTLQEVYSTQGFSDCPADLWSNVTVDGVNAQYGCYNSSLNGPRWWVMDSIDAGDGTANGPQATFGGLVMSRLAMMLLSPAKARFLAQTTSPLYKPAIVQRNTVFNYDAGTMMYQLTAPDGKVYTMQSISNQTQMDELANLGSVLTLPKGWSFSTLVLDEKFALSTQDNIAYIIRDSLQNTYQCSSANCY